jgi:hypothetical protein
MMKKKAAFAEFEILSWNLSGGTEEYRWNSESK